MKLAKIIVALPGCGTSTLAKALQTPTFEIVDSLENAPNQLIYTGPAHSRRLRKALESELKDYEIEYHCIELPKTALDYESIEDKAAFDAALKDAEGVDCARYSFQSCRRL